MFRNKYIRKVALFWISITVLLLSTPKTYIHSWLNHHHETQAISASGVHLTEQSNAECNFDTYNTPLFFDTIDFKTEHILFANKQAHVPNFYAIIYLKSYCSSNALRGPPQA